MSLEANQQFEKAAPAAVAKTPNFNDYILSGPQPSTRSEKPSIMKDPRVGENASQENSKFKDAAKPTPTPGFDKPPVIICFPVPAEQSKKETLEQADKLPAGKANKLDTNKYGDFNGTVNIDKSGTIDAMRNKLKDYSGTLERSDRKSDSPKNQILEMPPIKYHNNK